MGLKLLLLSSAFFKETMPKLSENLGNHILQDSHKNQYPSPSFGFTAPQYGDKCLSNLLKVPYHSH